MTLPRAVLYRGTGCSSKFMGKVKKSLMKIVPGFRKQNISNRCWIRTGLKSAPHFHTKKSISYLDVGHYNIPSGKFLFAAGHSAGGFPLALTNAKVKVGFNPFFTQYPFLDVVFHAKDDWLVIKDKPDFIKPKKLILYKGKHGSYPRKEFEAWLKDHFF